MRIKGCVRFAFALSAVLAIAGPGSTQVAPHNRILQAVDATQVAVVRGTAHPLARPQFDKGRTDPSRTISGAITFRLSASQQADLDQLLREQQDPKSSNYHRWLTPDQYASRFGMSSSDLAKVSAWLQSQGLNVDGISGNRNEIFFSGSVGQAEYAFKTQFHDYTFRGETHFANATAVSLPAAFSAEVLGVRGLTDFHPTPRVNTARPQLTSNISGNHFLAPGDFATIYDIPSTATGNGQKIAVIGQTLVSTSDLDTFRTNSNLPVTSASNFQPVPVPSTGTAVHCSGDETEADLDLEWSEAVAKNATIVYVYAGLGVGGSSCTNRSSNVFDALQYAITADLAPVISISYGNCEANLPSSFILTVQQWAQNANAQGQTISGPAGDAGAADCDNGVATRGLQVDVPAAIPEVTGVGGSEFNGDASACPSGSCTNNTAPATTYWSGSTTSSSTAPTALSYIPEMVWNDTAASLAGGGGLAATGGGASTIFGKPSWQKGTGVPADGQRDVPDVALNGSNGHDPYLICSQDFFTSQSVSATSCTTGFRASDSSFSAVGGTSAGAPTFAGILALLNEAVSPTGLGNVNPMLYSLAANNSANHAFHDIATGSNKVPCTSGTTDCPAGTTSIGFTATAGYDEVTGLGSIDVANLLAAWTGTTPAADFALAGQNATISAPGGTASPTVTLTSLNGFSGTVTVSCAASSSTAQISCSANPASVPVAANGTATTTLSIGTTAELLPEAPWQRRGTMFAATGGLFAVVILGGIPSKRRWLTLLGLLFGIVLFFGIGCGGGSSTPQQKSQGTPAGSYTITVTGTSGSTTHTSTVSVTVQ